MSPVIFALFLNDLENFLHSNECSGISLDFVSDSLYTYLSLFVLSYAEDTVIYGLNEKDFQKKKT